MKVIIASDSFKGSLSSAEVARAASRGVLSACRGAEVTTFTVGDGGEGTAEAITLSLGGERAICNVRDPLGNRVNAEYGIADLPAGRTAIIDVASAIGLTLVPESRRDVMKSTSFGVGELLADACSRGCRNFLIGLGGSATCDGGAGMLQALGAVFRDSAGIEIEACGRNLSKISEVEMSGIKSEVRDCTLSIISDVTNPLTGVQGAARVFAPQKGATPKEAEALEMGMERYASVVASATGRDFRKSAGAGAAGGLGFAFLSFFNCRMLSGGDAVLDIVGFDKALVDANLVITGEGSIDSQTLDGKLPLCVCRRAAAHGVDTVSIAGKVAEKETLLRHGFAGIYSINSDSLPAAEAMRPEVARGNVTSTVAAIVSQWLATHQMTVNSSMSVKETFD